MAGPRQLVPPPDFMPHEFGLLSVVQPRYDEPDVHWKNGVTWQDICGDGSTTFDTILCAESPTPSGKVQNVERETFGATPFTVFAEIDCSPVGYTQDEQRALGADALGRVEGWQVERAFWTGDAGGTADVVVYPHLAADESVADPNISTITLQCAATSVTGSAA